MLTDLLLAVRASLFLSYDIPASDTELVERVATGEAVSLLHHSRLITIVDIITTDCAYILIQLPVWQARRGVILQQH